MRKFYLVAMVALAFGCSKPEGYRKGFSGAASGPQLCGQGHG